MNNQELYGWVFTFNPYQQVWLAAKRENSNELFSGNEGNVLKSSSINTLQQLIIKTDGDEEKIKKLLK
jgi:hypothetical protein